MAHTMATRFYHKPTCSKSRETKKLLDENGVGYDTILYIENPPSYDELKDIAGNLTNATVQDLLRPKEAKEAGWGKGKDASDDEVLRFLAAHPTALQRPIVVKDGKAVLGRPVEDVKKLL